MLTKWEELKSYNCNPPVRVLERTGEMQASYEKHVMDLGNKNILVSDYIKNKYFSDNEKDKMCEISLNEFPYNIENNVYHLLLWFNPLHFNNDENLNDIKYTKLIESYVEKAINNKLIPYNNNLKYEPIYFENHNFNRSIRAIKHIHIFIKLCF